MMMVSRESKIVGGSIWGGGRPGAGGKKEMQCAGASLWEHAEQQPVGNMYSRLGGARDCEGGAEHPNLHGPRCLGHIFA